MLVRLADRQEFRELTVERANQLLAIVALKVERPRRVLVRSPASRLCSVGPVDVRPDRAPLFSKLNVKVPLSVEPLARDPHLIVRWTGFRSERAGDTQCNREPERLETQGLRFVARRPDDTMVPTGTALHCE